MIVEIYFYTEVHFCLFSSSKAEIPRKIVCDRNENKKRQCYAWWLIVSVGILLIPNSLKQLAFARGFSNFDCGPLFPE